MRISDAISGYGISDLRDITPTIAAGPTLETKPKVLAILKDNGVTSIVDFRGGSQPLIENACSQTGLNYYNFDFNHTISSGRKTIAQPLNFIEQLKQFFRIMNKGHAYIGCQYGVHRTNAALVYNHILNNPNGDRFVTPDIARLDGDRDINNTINFLSRKVWKTIKAMTPSEKSFFNLTGSKEEIFFNIIKKKAGELKRHAKIFL